MDEIVFFGCVLVNLGILLSYLRHRKYLIDRGQFLPITSGVNTLEMHLIVVAIP